MRAPGFADSETVDREMRRALCLLLPSRREGYGLVVVEAGRPGTPSVVVAGEDNAATELVEEGVNGAVAPDARRRAVADAIERVEAAGEGLRERTAEWFAANARAPLARVLAADGPYEIWPLLTSPSISSVPLCTVVPT